MDHIELEYDPKHLNIFGASDVVQTMRCAKPDAMCTINHRTLSHKLVVQSKQTYLTQSHCHQRLK